jgi:hypothetical protein
VPCLVASLSQPRDSTRPATGPAVGRRTACQPISVHEWYIREEDPLRDALNHLQGPVSSAFILDTLCRAAQVGGRNVRARWLKL